MFILRVSLKIWCGLSVLFMIILKTNLFLVLEFLYIESSWCIFSC